MTDGGGLWSDPGWKFPEWSGMPERAPIVVLSWEDIYTKARMRGIKLTRQQVIRIFDRMVQDGDLGDDGEQFWEKIDYHISEERNGV